MLNNQEQICKNCEKTKEEHISWGGDDFKGPYCVIDNVLTKNVFEPQESKSSDDMVIENNIADSDDTNSLTAEGIRQEQVKKVFEENPELIELMIKNPIIFMKIADGIKRDYIPLSKHNEEIESKDKLIRLLRNNISELIEEKRDMSNKFLSRINSIQEKAEKGCGAQNIHNHLRNVGSTRINCGEKCHCDTEKKYCKVCSAIIKTCKEIKNSEERGK